MSDSEITIMGMTVEEFELLHYGVKGMQWGVTTKRVGGAARNFVLGNPKTSVLYKEGRANARKDVSTAAKATSKFFKSQGFKNVVLGKSSVLHEQGRKQFQKDLDGAVKAVNKVANNKHVKTAVAGKSDTSVFRTEGRKNFKSNVKQDVDNVVNGMKSVAGNKHVKAVAVGHSSVLTKSGRAELRSDVQKVRAGITNLQKSLSDRVKHEEEDDDPLQHYGRKGMKWGQTVYSKVSGSGRGNKVKGKEVTKMSDAVLKKRVKRLELEKSYKRLEAEKAQANKGRLRRGIDETEKIIKSSVRTQVQKASNQIIGKALTESLKQVPNKNGGVVDLFDKDN